VTRQLDELRERIGEAVTAATQKVIAEFDQFGESLLGKETYWKRRVVDARRDVLRPMWWDSTSGRTLTPSRWGLPGTRRAGATPMGQGCGVCRCYRWLSRPLG
jgi:hypothetical protein